MATIVDYGDECVKDTAVYKIIVHSAYLHQLYIYAAEVHEMSRMWAWQ